MLNYVRLKNNGAPKAWHHVNDLVGQIKPQLAHFCFFIILPHLVQLVIQVDEHSDFTQLLAVLEIVLVYLERVFVPQVVSFLAL